MTSMSPACTLFLTPLHLVTKTSPLCRSTTLLLSCPYTSKVPQSRSTRTNTDESKSGVSTMLTPPDESSNLCSDVGKDDKKAAL